MARKRKTATAKAKAPEPVETQLDPRLPKWFQKELGLV